MDTGIIQQLGYFAFLYSGKKLTENPYSARIEREAWEKGWKDAERLYRVPQNEIARKRFENS